MKPADTSKEAFEHQLELYRQAGTAGRSHIAAEISEAVRATTFAAIRQRHPEYSDAEVRAEFVRVVYGIDIR